MKKTFFVLIAFSMLVACTPMKTRDTGQKEISDTDQSEVPDATRTLEIDGKTYNNYTLWDCSESSGDWSTVLRLVITNRTFNDIYNEKHGGKKVNKKLQKVNVGFILFDGMKEHTMAGYKRMGINHEWHWGEGKESYIFVIKPTGTGLYYDFTNVKKGGTTTARDVFKCEKNYE